MNYKIQVIDTLNTHLMNEDLELEIEQIVIELDGQSQDIKLLTERD